MTNDRPDRARREGDILTNKHKNRPPTPRHLTNRHPNITLETILRPRRLILRRQAQKPRLRTQPGPAVTSTRCVFAAVGECRRELAGAAPALERREGIADAAEVVAQVGGGFGGGDGEALDSAAVGEGVEVWAVCCFHCDGGGEECRVAIMGKVNRNYWKINMVSLALFMTSTCGSAFPYLLLNRLKAFSERKKVPTVPRLAFITELSDCIPRTASSSRDHKITVAEITLQQAHRDWVRQTSGLGSAIRVLERDCGLRGGPRCRLRGLHLEAEGWYHSGCTV